VQQHNHFSAAKISSGFNPVEIYHGIIVRTWCLTSTDLRSVMCVNDVEHVA